MKDFWNERFGQEEFSYGIEPNEFFEQQLDKLLPGKILLPAEGEGRNAVYAAKNGWDVHALDFSESGNQKAMQLAEHQGVSISYEVINALNFSSDMKFDVMSLIYAHFPSDIRSKVHRHLLPLVKPNGRVIFEAFSKKQLGKASGGPKNLEMLFSLDEVRNEFQGLNFQLLEEVDIQLDEGIHHIGDATVIRFVGQKSDD